MKYMILHYFFMVQLCNIKMSAASPRHKSKGKHYDIDGFISQLLASRKFDDLADKLAEKAASKMKLIEPPHFPIERATDDNDFENRTKKKQKVNQNQLNRKIYVKKYENNQLNNVKLRKDFTGKINPQAVINVTTSLTDNLQLKYKYFKKNALEKKVKAILVQLPKNVTKENITKHNNTQTHINHEITTTIKPAELKVLINKTEKHSLKQNTTAVTKNDTMKPTILFKKRSQDDQIDDSGKENSNRNSESYNTGIDGEINDSSKKPDHSLEEQSQGHEHTVFREGQNSGLEDKGLVEQETSRVDRGITEEKPSSLEEENEKHMTRSEERTVEEVEKTEGEPKNRGADDINEDGNVNAQFRAHKDSIEDNNVTSNHNPNGRVHRSKSSDNSNDHSPEDKSSKKQSGEDPNSSKVKPVIRQEGDKLYTYVKAPEYQDYHEELAKWQKLHPHNPADFMK